MNIDDEELLDKEVSMIKDKSQHRDPTKTPTVHSQSPDEEQNVMNQLSNRDNSNKNVDQTVLDEEDNLEAEIDQLVKKKVPKKRRTLKGSSNNKNVFDNRPPKRIKADDVKELFPHLKIEQAEQRRLAKIASSISGLAY